jgi:polysaccharide export outer membrane protein
VPAPETFSVEVLGSVDRPGEITMHEGDKLAMAIAKAGASPNTNPDLNKIEVKRTLPDGSTKTYTINLYETLKDGNINNDLTMQKGDIVFVPQARKPTFGSGMFSFLESLLFWIPK